MSSDANASIVSSQLGRQWLHAINQGEPAPSAEEPELLVVAFPDVSDLVDTTKGAFDHPNNNPDQLAASLVMANNGQTGQNESAPQPSENDLAIVSHFAEATLDERSVNITTKQQQVSADIAEPSTDWSDEQSNRESKRTKPEKPSKESGSKNTNSSANPLLDGSSETLLNSKPIVTLANSILERFPLGDPTVLTFVGSESNLHIDETCARLASELAARRVGRILLLDADTHAKSLSRASGIADQPGLTNVVNEALDWESVIYGRSATNLDFLSAGTGDLKKSGSESRLRQLVADLKQAYQFICVSAGDAHSLPAKLWNDISDGSYLLVSIKNSNETHAKSAVAEMQTGGARLLGCVVTDVD